MQYITDPSVAMRSDYSHTFLTRTCMHPFIYNYLFIAICIHATYYKSEYNKLGEPYIYLKPVEQTLFSATVPIKKGNALQF